jgi:hypothetical protein
MSTLVAGIDSSTQSCKVVIREAGSGALAREDAKGTFGARIAAQRPDVVIEHPGSQPGHHPGQLRRPARTGDDPARRIRRRLQPRIDLAVLGEKVVVRVDEANAVLAGS